MKKSLREFMAIICVTEAGNKLAENISNIYEIHIYKRCEVKERGIKDVTQEAFSKFNFVIFISSTGIAVRSIAPFIKSKTEDPGVLVIDNSSRYIISLLSGHIGGANELTQKLSSYLGAMPIITTATDNLGVIAPDVIAKDNELIIDDMKICKDVAVSLVHGEKVAFLDEDNKILLPKGYESYKEDEKYKAIVIVTNKVRLDIGEKIDNIPILKLIRKNIVLGIGCKKDYDSFSMEEKVFKKLSEMNIDKRSVKIIGTAWIKEKEEAIINLKQNLNCEMKVFSKEEIKKVQCKYKGSDFVEKTLGIRCVCEPSVELSGGILFTDKMPMQGMTLCIGKLFKTI